MELKNSTSPIFILGSPRSGTTLLRVLLSSHSNISIPHEFTLIENVIKVFANNLVSKKDVIKFIKQQYNYSHFRDWKLEEELLINSFQKKSKYKPEEIIETFYLNYLNEWNSNAKRWGDKNIGSLSYIKEIVTLFPNAKFIHIIRDARDVSTSLLERNWMFYKFPKYQKRCINNIIGAAETWNLGITIINDSKKYIRSENFLEIRYEDLLKDISLELKKICIFLEENFEESMLDYYQKEKEKKTISKNRLENNHENIYKPIQKDNLEKYKQKLSNKQIALIEKICKKNLKKYNYKLDNILIKNLDFKMSLIKYNILFNFHNLLYNFKGFVKRIIIK